MPKTASNKPKHRNQHPPTVTRHKQALFLQAYQQTCSVLAACKQVGIADSCPFKWSVSNEAFSKRYEEVKLEVEKQLISRYEHKFDTECLDDKEKLNKVTVIASMFRMKRLDPRYRDNAIVNVNLPGPAATVFEVVDIQEQRTPTTGLLPDEQPKK